MHRSGPKGAAAILAAALMFTSAASASPASQTVPKSFKANSITWLTPKQGWVLGAVPCGKTTCATVVATTDGARTWQRIGSIPTAIAKMGQQQDPGVEEIRFGTASIGWAYEPFLFRTTNGGRSWSRVPMPGGGKQVLAMAVGPTSTFAIVSTCRWATGLCNHKPLTLWRTPTGAVSWTQIALALPANVAGPDVEQLGDTVYVVDPQVDVSGAKDKFYASTDGGQHFAPRPVPCDKTQDVALIQAVPYSATDVALLCDGNPGFSKAQKFVYVSTNTGKTDHFKGQMGVYGIQAQLAASPSGNLAVASYSDGSFIYRRGATDSRWRRVIASGDGGAGWNDITYVTNKVGWVVGGPAELPSDIGKLLVTHDATAAKRAGRRVTLRDGRIS